MMLLLLQQTITSRLILTILIISLIGADSTSQCNHSCGDSGGSLGSLPYPFGFSDGCPIRLNCSQTGEVTVGGFVVQNVTAGSLLIDMPAKCDRPIAAAKGLFGHNYSPTIRNGILLQNCSSPPKNCVIPTSMMESKLELQGCDARSENISCYSVEVKHQGSELMTYDNMSRSSCGTFFSSIAVDNSSRNSVVSLELQKVELGWWLAGHCRCSTNANCTVVSLPNGLKGYRCRCKEGFEGDGFKAGDGCKKVPDCNGSNYVSAGCGGNTKVVLIGGIMAGAALMAALGLLFYYIQRRSNSLRRRLSAKRLVSEAAGSSSVPFYPYKEIERSTNGFSEKQRLGTGAYGTVYAGKLHSDEWVAIKKIRHRDTDSTEQVMNEIKLLSAVSHPNLVRLLGCCIDKGEQILVYEFMPNGTLSQHLQRERGNGLPWTARLTIATETAQAIAHLHSMNPPIYHRDIKSSNILLDANFKSKVADFGLSRLGMSLTDDSHISTAPQGTPGYLDPQYHQSFHLSDKSDVYSFGVVLVEIITALKVVDFSRSHGDVNLAALAIERIGKGRVDEIIDPFLEPNRDAWTLSSIHKVAELAFRCLAFHRDMRPSMMEVAEELEQIKGIGWVAPLDMESSVASSYYEGSEKSIGGNSCSIKKGAISSKKLIVPHRAMSCLSPMEEVKDSSPVSVHDPWLSEQSSPSTNSLLDNVVQ